MAGRHVRQQAGPALDGIFAAGFAFLDAHPVHRVVAQRRFIRFLQRQRVRRHGEGEADGGAEGAARNDGAQAGHRANAHHSPPIAAGMRSRIGRKM